MSALYGKNILLIISGGIAAYKGLELIREIKREGGNVKCILTAGGAQFITALSVGGLSGEPVYTDLFSLKDETEMGHIRLSREADLIVIAPASANLLARVADGKAEDLASTVLLAANKPVIMAPAMNHVMWDNEATQKNIRTLTQRGYIQVGPTPGDMACGEFGMGRMAEPLDIVKSIISHFENGNRLKGYKALVTSGPTYEPIDPVRFIGNRSSGKQGHAIAAALQSFGADVTLVTGPVALPPPAGVNVIEVETAQEMLAACQSALPADIAVCAAAVSDWSVASASAQKIKKRADKTLPDIKLQENPDILATLSSSKSRPKLVIGFAAETENLLPSAKEKLARKGCTWIVANDVAANPVFGADNNHVFLVTDKDTNEWQGSKKDIAQNIALAISKFFEKP